MPFYWLTFSNKSPDWALFTQFFSLPPAHNWRWYCYFRTNLDAIALVQPQPVVERIVRIVGKV
jgi:hypothetical protein